MTREVFNCHINTIQILDEKKGKEIKLCENNINIELNMESNLDE